MSPIVRDVRHTKDLIVFFSFFHNNHVSQNVCKCELMRGVGWDLVSESGIQIHPLALNFALSMVASGLPIIPNISDKRSRLRHYQLA